MPELRECPFCKDKNAAVSIMVDADAFRGTIGVFCGNRKCGGAYLGTERRLHYGSIADFVPEDIREVVDGWNRRDNPDCGGAT